MASVASQIRIDLLTNAASFNAGMASGGRDGFGSFKEQAEKFDRWFNSRKSVAQRMKEQEDAWTRAMQGTGGPLANVGGGSILGQSLSGGMSKELESLHNQMRHDVRIRDMLPWGQSMRTELSREAALTAAAIGDGKQRIVGSLSKAMQEIGGSAAGAAGMGGGFGSLMGLAGAHPFITAGAGVAAFLVQQEVGRHHLAEEVRTNALTLGQGTRDTSLMMGAGLDQPTLSKFQRSMAEQGPQQMEAFNKLGLDPNKLKSEPMIQALQQVGAAFDGLKSPADKANAAIELFGRGGADMIATLSDMKDNMDLVAEADIISPETAAQVKAFNNDWKAAWNEIRDLAYEINEGIGTLLSTITGAKGGFLSQVGRGISYELEAAKQGIKSLWGGADWTKLDEMDRRFKKEDYKIEHADEIEKARIAQAKVAEQAERETAARKKAEEAVKSVAKELDRMGMTSEQRELAAFKDKLDTAGIKDEAMPHGMSRYYEDRFKEEHQPRTMAIERFQKQQQDKADDDALKTLTKKTAEDTYNEGVNKAEGLFQRKKINAEQLFSIERRLLQDYYKEAEQLDAEAIRKRLRSGHEEYQRDLANLRAHGRDVGLTPDEINRETGRRSDVERKRLGVSNPLGDFAKDMEEHRKALSDGTITQKEFNDWRTKRQKSAVSEMVGETPSIRLNGAMAAGSAEAHSLIAQASTSDPRTKAAIDAVNVLNRIAAVLESGKAVDEQMLRALNEAII